MRKLIWNFLILEAITTERSCLILKIRKKRRKKVAKTRVKSTTTKIGFSCNSDSFMTIDKLRSVINS